MRHSGVDFKPFCLVHGHGLRMFAFIAFLGGLVFFLDYEKNVRIEHREIDEWMVGYIYIFTVLL